LAKSKRKFLNQSCECNGKLKLCTHAAISAQSHQRGAQVNKSATDNNNNKYKQTTTRGRLYGEVKQKPPGISPTMGLRCEDDEVDAFV